MNELRRQLLRASAGVIVGGVFAAPARADEPAALDGVWVGALMLPQGGRADFALRVAPGKDGAHVVRVTLPDIHAFDAPIAEVEALGDRRFRFDPFGSVATLDGDRLTGEFAYLRVPFELKRAAKLPDWRETREPALPEPPPLRWTRTLPAGAWASPVSAGGVAYVGDTAGNLHALRVRDGTTVWMHAHGTPIYGDACVDPTGVTFVDERGTLCRVDRRTGRRAWHLDLDLDAAAAGGTSADFTFTHRTPRPTRDGDVLYVGGRDRRVRAVDVRTGRVRWERDVGGAVMSGIAVAGPRLVAGTFDRNGVVALDRRDGRVVWTFATAQPVSSTPVISGDVVMAGCRDFGIHGLALATGTPRWVQSYLFSWVESSPAVAGPVAYFGSSDLRSVRAIEIATGRTQFTTDVRGITWGTPALAGTRIYAGTAGQTGVLIAHRPGLCALDRRSGALLWRRELAMGDATTAGIASSPCHADGTIVAAAVDGAVYAIAAA